MDIPHPCSREVVHTRRKPAKTIRLAPQESTASSSSSGDLLTGSSSAEGTEGSRAPGDIYPDHTGMSPSPYSQHRQPQTPALLADEPHCPKCLWVSCLTPKRRGSSPGQERAPICWRTTPNTPQSSVRSSVRTDEHTHTQTSKASPEEDRDSHLPGPSSCFAYPAARAVCQAGWWPMGHPERQLLAHQPRSCSSGQKTNTRAKPPARAIATVVTCSSPQRGHSYSCQNTKVPESHHHSSTQPSPSSSPIPLCIH